MGKGSRRRLPALSPARASGPPRLSVPARPGIPLEGPALPWYLINAEPQRSYVPRAWNVFILGGSTAGFTAVSLGQLQELSTRGGTDAVCPCRFEDCEHLEIARRLTVGPGELPETRVFMEDTAPVMRRTFMDGEAHVLTVTAAPGAGGVMQVVLRFDPEDRERHWHWGSVREGTCSQCTRLFDDAGHIGCLHRWAVSEWFASIGVVSDPTTPLAVLRAAPPVELPDGVLRFRAASDRTYEVTVTPPRDSGDIEVRYALRSLGPTADPLIIDAGCVRTGGPEHLRCATHGRCECADFARPQYELRASAG